jgi:hypothetical protein
MPTTPATREGGAVSTSVIVVLKPSEDTTVGKNCNGASALLSTGSLSAAYLVERRGTQVHILHEDEQVEPWIAKSLHEASAGSLGLFQANCIPLHTFVC